MLTSFRKYLLLLQPALLPLTALWSQNHLTGQVLNGISKYPVSFASVGIKNKNAGSVADSAGKFSIHLPSVISGTDTVIISAIGYQQISGVVQDFSSQKTFWLSPLNRVMQEVILFNNKELIEIGKIPKHGPSFTMGWGHEGQGGEAGNVFTLPFRKYKIEKIQAKINTTYDSCWFRVHIRNMINGIPGEELLGEELIIAVSEKDGPVEFDFSGKNVVLHAREIFIGIEFLKHSVSTSPSSGKNNFMVYYGNEPARYACFHKWYSHSAWEFGKGHSFSMKLTVRR